MAEIDRIGAYIIRIYSNEPEFEQPHVHVWRAGTWVKIRIPTKTKAARVLGASRRRMAPAHVVEAVRIVEASADAYAAAYERLREERHGKATD